MSLDDIVTIFGILFGLGCLAWTMLRFLTSWIDPRFARTLWYFIVGPPERVSIVSVNPAPAPPPDEQTDTQTDQVSALIEAAERLQLDRTRKAIIDTLVLAGWDVSAIRSALKGDNGAIGAEIAEARKRFAVQPEPRPVVMRDISGVRVVDLNSGERVA